MYNTGHFCLWKKGIHHGDVSLGNLMWDDRRKVGILNDFDLARFADQDGASGKDNTGTLPYMALDLLSEKGLRGEIPRRYRHEAESFAWSMICLCLATVEDKDGKNYTLDPHPLHQWFQDWKTSRSFKLSLQWDDHDNPNIPLVHPNAKPLAQTLYKYWLERYTRQFPLPSGAEVPSLVAKIFEVADIMAEDPRYGLHYEEPEDGRIFLDLLIKHDKVFRAGPLEETRDDFFKMTSKYKEIDWDA